MPVARKLGLPIVAMPPALDEAPKVCKQDSIGMQANTEEQGVFLKVHQKLYWGSPKWWQKWKARTHVESMFGILKGDNAAAKKRGSSLTIGLAQIYFEMAAFVALANIIELRAWHKKTGLGDPEHPLLAPIERPRGFLHLTHEEYEGIQNARSENQERDVA
jgi:hypothetical protein